MDPSRELPAGIGIGEKAFEAMKTCSLLQLRPPEHVTIPVHPKPSSLVCVEMVGHASGRDAL